ncbi:hypothetical protein AMTR_s00170p00034360 [Amborella trichopoda]|uniref:Delta(3)-Delta(2)-enoyl-CoA isomerase n=2 Tax=Amborella trichopoda TaxID=13333 RepID=W1NUJ7_AMBTC|nr:hypothetical protein AMTR_s00170p00034360 [Amborella trichopoda]
MCSLERRGLIFILTLTGEGEHRLNPPLLDAILSCLHQVSTSQGGAALITTSHGKFFSNGFDLKWVEAAGPENIPSRFHTVGEKLKQITLALMNLPMPTIAAVCGHAAAAGFLFALSHDYIFMRKDRGFLYMSELDIGLVLPNFFMSVLRAKIPKPGVLREVVLEARKITGREAEEKGIIARGLSDSGETMASAVRFMEELSAKGWDGRVYAGIRRAAFPEIVEAASSSMEGKGPIGSRL